MVKGLHYYCSAKHFAMASHSKASAMQGAAHLIEGYFK